MRRTAWSETAKQPGRSRTLLLEAQITNWRWQFYVYPIFIS